MKSILLFTIIFLSNSVFAGYELMTCRPGLNLKSVLESYYRDSERKVRHRLYFKKAAYGTAQRSLKPGECSFEHSAIDERANNHLFIKSMKSKSFQFAVAFEGFGKYRAFKLGARADSHLLFSTIGKRMRENKLIIMKVLIRGSKIELRKLF